MVALSSKLLARLTDPQIDALIEAMLLAASADGELDYSELTQLRKSLLSVDDLWLSHVDLDQRVSAAKANIAGQDRTARLTAIKSILNQVDERVAALELAAMVVAADGVVRTSERDLILEVAEILEVDSEVAANIMVRVTKATP